jgi:hypothetical protein
MCERFDITHPTVYCPEDRRPPAHTRQSPVKKIRREACLIAAGVLSAAILFVPVALFSAEAPRKVKLARDGREYSAIRIEIDAVGGGVQPIYLIESKKAASPKRAFFLFGGGAGRVNHVRRRSEGVYKISKNFLMRIIKEIVDEGVAAVPVGMWTQLDGNAADDFRLGKNNAKNMTRAVRILAGRGYEEIFIVGTSRGTMDAAGMAVNLKDPGVKGVIFTATMGDDGGILALPLDKIRYPVLFLHNRYDGCHVTIYESARKMFGRFKSSPRRHFVTVSAAAIAEGRECGAMAAHGFLGAEASAARVMTDWAKGKTPPGEIFK